MPNTRLNTEPNGSWYSNYAPLPGIPDEFLNPNGQPRAAWLAFLQHLGSDDQTHALAAAERHIRDIGVTYRAPGDALERPWPMSRLPLIIDDEDWRAIAAGVSQRAELIEKLLSDIYGEGRLVADGVLPAAVVGGSSDFLRPLVGVQPPGGRWVHLYAADIGRGPDGRWWVLSDRTQAPSGTGYALENRLVMARALPTSYRRMNVERLAPFFRAFRASLTSAAERSQPRICLMTPGPFSETYFEQAYLARYLGFLLVEGDDLVVHDGLTHVRTIAGLKRADVIWRRVDSDYVDPLELRGQSRLGVPGLISAIRNGHTVVSNMPGSGFAESRALMSFMPSLAQSLLDQDLLLPNIATWWCGEPEARRSVLADFDEVAISGAFTQPMRGFGDAQQLTPASMSREQRENLHSAIEQRGMDFVGQELVNLSTTPIWLDGQFVPRPFVLRVYAAATPDGWHVMPGGFCRISAHQDSRAISMGEGAQSADVWVLSSKPVAHESLLPAANNVPIQRILHNIPSRAADNLFWYGRYLERAEATLRVVRCLCARTIEMDMSSDDVSSTLGKLTRQLVAWGAIPPELQNAPTLTLLRHALVDESSYGSGLSAVRLARNAGAVIRERISVDASRLLRRLDTRLSTLTEFTTETDALEASEQALQTLSALAGFSQENVNRNAGWRFLDIGRRVERAINTCRLARSFAAESATADDLDVMLDLIDCQITYRSRYMTGVALDPVRDMALLDPFNPRSVGFQLTEISRHLAPMPALHGDGLPEEPQRLATRLVAEVETADVRSLDANFILALEQKISNFANAVAERYFLRRPQRPAAKGTLS